jgi:hypothetical protein|tara:strand:- start:1401 stop:2294 length:894 start_codon:yes stop_codon:yes gene_type:complete
MPRNQYFSLGATSEKNLYEDIVVEGLRIYGHDVYYLPRSIINEDGIFNEASLSEFGEAFQIEMYVENIDGFEGEGDLLSKFGLEMRDQMSLIVSNRRWEQLVGRFQTVPESRPQEGDLIYFPLVKGLFQIQYVEEETPFYQLQNIPTFKLKCELFEYSNEAIDTGVGEIDEFETKFASRTTLTLGTGTGTFATGEDVTQTVGALTISGEIAEIRSGEVDVVGITSSDGTNVSFSITGDSNGNIIGSTSGASYAITLKDTFNNMDEFDAFADNEEFESVGNNFIDFTEMNPFGTPNIT